MALTGKGFFIWQIKNCEGGDAEAIAEKAVRSGLTHVLVKIADTRYPFGNPAQNQAVVNALHNRRIQVWGWHYVKGDDPNGEARVAVKLPDSASSAGNIVLDRETALGLSPPALRAELLRLLRRAGWNGDFPLIATAWESPLTATPSVQVWIPAQEAGDPVVEGVFDQLVAGAGRAFGGARPSMLGPTARERLAVEAAALGLVFQGLGYFGRCSFDAILLGDGGDRSEPHWVECNGRWGGVSIPMTLANRLVGDWTLRPFAVTDRADLEGPRRRLKAVLAALGDRLFRAGTRPTGVVVLSPARLEDGTGFELMAIADTVEAATTEAGRVATELAAGHP